MNTTMEIVPVEQQQDLAAMFGYIAHSLTESSMAMYKRDFAAYMDYAEKQELHPLLPATLATFRDHMIFQTSKSPLTINRMLAAVKRVMKEARKQGLISRDTAMDFQEIDGASIHKLRDRMKHTSTIPTSREQMKALVNAPDDTTLVGLRDKALLYTLVSSGVRAGELSDLLVSRVYANTDGCFIQVMGKKDDTYRTANLSPDAFLYIQEWVQKRGVASEYVFTQFHAFGTVPTAHKMSARDVWEQVTHYAQRIGLDYVSPHTFRRFVGTQLAKTDIRQAQLALGHASINTTAKHYVLDELKIGQTDDLI
jgi:site-specific recombinase XerD